MRARASAASRRLDRHEGLGTEPPTEDRRGEEHAPVARGERVDAGRHERAEGLRDLHPVRRFEHLETLVPGPGLAAVDQHPQHLHPVERHAAGTLDDPPHDARREVRPEAEEQFGHLLVGQRLELDRREAVVTGAPCRALVEELGAGQGHDEDRVGARPRRDVIDEVEQRRVGPLEVLEDQEHRRPVGDALEEPAPGREELVPFERDVRARIEQGRQPRLDPATLGLVRHELDERPLQLPAGHLALGALADPGPSADHLGKRGERDAVAVGRGPPDVERKAVGQGVEVALELPDEAALAHAGDADHRHDPAAPSGHGAAHTGRRARRAPSRGRRTVRRGRPRGPWDARRRGRRRATPATGWLLPLSMAGLVASNTIGSPTRRLVVSSTRTVFDGAAAWRRAAVLTRSPATMPWPSAPRVTAASPLPTAARALRRRSGTAPRSLPTAATSSSAARTARSASSSCATGAPHSAMTASPMNFSRVPP